MTKKTVFGFSLLFLFAFTFGFAFTLASSAEASYSCCIADYCEFYQTYIWGHEGDKFDPSGCVWTGDHPCDTPEAELCAEF